jgi:hypothetical protein
MGNPWPDDGERPIGPLGMAVFYGLAWLMWGLMASVAILFAARLAAGPPGPVTVAAGLAIGFGLAGWALRRAAQGRA